MQPIVEELSEAPDPAKRVLRSLQNGYKRSLEPENGDIIATYREDCGVRISHIGLYNSQSDQIESEYVLSYDPDNWELTFGLNNSRKDLEKVEKMIRLPEDLYQNLHDIDFS